MFARATFLLGGTRAPGKSGIKVNSKNFSEFHSKIIFLISQRKVYCDSSLEPYRFRTVSARRF